ncbi:hypothetical protein CFC21_091820 [Triticum aestivum]|uniref:Uncharacterized protein n=3 Tax=Triticinae TaxID=1648030 RepID=A0A452XFL7_AEGTS|nr:disease resistance protein RGA5-like [Triticum aestivum]XP_045088093.1 disease resistance protein RGA5 [Aegilops tauschii subsp. strangulata]KAF7088748.1 hypothetical protein CFC21_091820 [Triticum aestivum]
MSAPVVSATMGAMNPLIGKLAALMGDEYKKLTSVRKQASFLKDELSAMKALLEKLELMNELDPLAKNWRDHVREMSYDMENCIDDFMRDLGGADAKMGFIKKTAKRLKTLRKRHRIADRMEELKALALQANERRMRYLIVVDDLWDQSTWNIISCIFPEVGKGNRVIVTTRMDDVAMCTCRNNRKCVYKMKPLKEEDSRMLFFNRVFGSEYDCPPQFKDVSAEILKKCGGLPLAIITIASLLANRQTRSKDEWESIINSLGAKFATNPTLEEMRSILNLSYIHLPLHLRPCLLYLGMYPEDKKIKRQDLVLQWVAEGFVNNCHGLDFEDVGKSYFNELINRSLIQPTGTSNSGEVEYCRVHDIMLDLIVSKCAEENFISVAYNCEDMARMHAYEYKVRRLSLKSSANDATLGIIGASMSQVRSFAQFGESKYTPALSLFKYLRVLVYDFPYQRGTTVDLTVIGQLFQLRYLSVCAFACIIDLPTEIRGLVHLETLEISGHSAQIIPSDIVCLSRLSRLTLPYGTCLPQGIASIKSLRDLHCFEIEKSSLEDINGLGELTNLRYLGFRSQAMMTEVVDALVSSIGKLRDLKHLFIHNEPSKHYCDPMYSFSNPPLHIVELRLGGWRLKGIPSWIGKLHCLRILYLSIGNLSTDVVHVVGKLPSLAELVLTALHVTGDRAAAIICMGSFPVLEVLKLISDGDDDATTCMEFKAGAMPNLRELTLGIRDGWGGVMPLGMENLLALERIYVSVESSVHKHCDVKTAFTSAADLHPRCPSVKIYPPSL